MGGCAKEGEAIHKSEYGCAWERRQVKEMHPGG